MDAWFHPPPIVILQFVLLRTGLRMDKYELQNDDGTTSASAVVNIPPSLNNSRELLSAHMRKFPGIDDKNKEWGIGV